VGTTNGLLCAVISVLWAILLQLYVPHTTDSFIVAVFAFIGTALAGGNMIWEIVKGGR
jgi:hypothetical protein